MITPVMTPIAKWCFNQLNLATLGGLSPFIKSFELGCATYDQAVLDAEGIWMKMVPQIHIDVHEGQAYVDVVRPMMSDQEREIMSRTKPDYSNLRAVANGDYHPRSILDEDSLWVGQGTTSKSAHRYDEADRGRDFQRHSMA